MSAAGLKASSCADLSDRVDINRKHLLPPAREPPPLASLLSVFPPLTPPSVNARRLTRACSLPASYRSRSHLLFYLARQGFSLICACDVVQRIGGSTGTEPHLYMRPEWMLSGKMCVYSMCRCSPWRHISVVTGKWPRVCCVWAGEARLLSTQTTEVEDNAKMTHCLLVYVQWIRNIHGMKI